jgi:hypothetical protein
MDNLKQIDAKLYTTDVYINKDRWVSYYWQTKLIKDLVGQGSSVLEVGVGNNVVANYLRGLYSLSTVDIDKDLKPDYLASVENMKDIGGESFDLVLCAEVLEHLEFEKFSNNLMELSRISKKYLIVSLPYWGYTFGLKFKLPILGLKVVKFKIN